MSQGGEQLAPLRSHAGVALIVATVLASGVASYDAYVVTVAVPAIGKDLDASVTALQWTLTSYLLTVGGLLLLAGALADRFGRRRVLETGLVMMFVSSVLCAAAPSIGDLIAARIIQGVGAALVVPTSLALLNGTLQVPDRARGIGIWAGLSTLATTVGPYAGGWLIDRASWRWVFVLNLPLIVAAVIALQRVPVDRSARRELSLDGVGALLAVAGLGGLTYAVTTASTAGWLSARVIVTGLLGLFAFAALVPVERRLRAPMLRLSLFASRQFDAINVTTLLFYGALSAAGYLLILECELRLGYTAAQAGAALIPSSVVFLALSPVSGALVARVGPRWLMVAGILLVAASYVWLGRARPGSSYITAILPPGLLRGLGLGLTVTPLTAAVLAAVKDDDLGEASAVNDAASRVGGVLAVALVPVLIGAGVGHSLAGALVNGYQPAMVTLGGICVVAAVVTGVFVSDERARAPRLAPVAPDRGCALPVVAEEVAA
jgi:EmrB/QacA subfamily drug resistance transporter